MTAPVGLQIGTNASAEVTRLEAEFAALQLRLDNFNQTPYARSGPGSIIRKVRTGIQEKLTALRDRINGLTISGSQPTVTPPPDNGGPGPEAVGPVFAANSLTLDRTGVDSLKILTTPRVL